MPSRKIRLCVTTCGVLLLVAVITWYLTKEAQSARMEEQWAKQRDAMEFFCNWKNHPLYGNMPRSTLQFEMDGETRKAFVGLNLSESNFDGVDLKHLEPLRDHLKRLSFSNSHLTDAGLVHLRGLPRLQLLVLNHTSVTDDGVVHLKDLKNLKYLLMVGTDVSNQGLAQLTGLSELLRLNLSGTKVTDDGLVHLKRLRKLKHLDLAGTAVTDRGVGHLVEMPALERVDLSITKVTDDGIAQLKRNRSLKGLNLHSTDVTDRAIEHLTNLICMSDLDIGNTRVTSQGVFRLKQVFPNVTLNVFLDGYLFNEYADEHRIRTSRLEFLTPSELSRLKEQLLSD